MVKAQLEIMMERNAGRAIMKFSLILAFLIVAVYPWYFSRFPVFLSGQATDIAVGVSVFIVLLVALSTAFITNNRWLIGGVLLGILMVFIFRSIRFFRTPVPALWDSYLHLSTLSVILETGRVSIVDGPFASVLAKTIYWPVMHVLAAIITLIADIPMFKIWSYQSPLIGVLLFILIFSLARNVSGSKPLALVAATISTLSPTVIAYQTEMHPQGFVLIFLAGMIYTYIEIITGRGLRFKLLFLLFTACLVLSHYYTPLVLIGVFGLTFVAISARSLLGEWAPIPQVNIRSFTIVPLAVFAIAGLFYHFATPSIHLDLFISLAVASSGSPETSLAPGNISLLSDIIKTMRWVVLAIALPGLIYAFCTAEPRKVILSLLIGSLLIMGFVGQVAGVGPVGRTVILYSVFIGVMVAMSAGLMMDITQRRRPKFQIPVTIVLVVLLASVATFTTFGGMDRTAYYFHSEKPNEEYINSNVVVKSGLYPPAGEWFDKHDVERSTVITDRNSKGMTGSLAYWFGKTPAHPPIFPWYKDVPKQTLQRTDLVEPALGNPPEGVSYYILNNRFEHGGATVRSTKVYDNGEVSTYYHYRDGERKLLKASGT